MLAYLIRMFPQLSETFIASEIAGLERLGMAPHVYSYRRPVEVVRHDWVRRVHSPVAYLPDPLYRHPWRLWRAHRALHRARPERYRATLRYVAAESARELRLDLWRDFVQAGYLAVAVTQAGVKHMHAHMAHTATQVAMLASMLIGVPFSFTAHARDIYLSRPADLRKRIAAAAFVATCTRANGNYLGRVAGPEHERKIHVHYHGVDLGRFSPRPPPPEASPTLILSVGRLVAKKGFADLLEACALLEARGKQFRCRIIGEGPDRKCLERLVERLGLEGVVELPGAMPQEELIAVYRQATVFALPCRVDNDGDRDGIPNVLVEAMAIGVPVVSSAISGIPELIANGRNGLLVPERDVEALAWALARLIGDGALRAWLARKARATVVARFDAGANVQALASLFRERGLAPQGQLAGEERAVGKAVGS